MGGHKCLKEKLEMRKKEREKVTTSDTQHIFSILQTKKQIEESYWRTVLCIWDKDVVKAQDTV